MYRNILWIITIQSMVKRGKLLSLSYNTSNNTAIELDELLIHKKGFTVIVYSYHYTNVFTCASAINMSMSVSCVLNK